MSREFPRHFPSGSQPMETFSEHEKRFVLAELIKNSDVDISILADFLRLRQLPMNWHLIEIPPRRNIDQCFRATESALNLSLAPPALPPKRPSYGQFYDETASERRNTPSPFDTHAQQQQQQQQQQYQQQQQPPYQQPYQQQQRQPTAPRAINIKPKVASVAPIQAQAQHSPKGFSVFASNPSPTQSTGPSKRKRGRPSKADKEAEARARGINVGQVPLTPVLISPAPPPSQITTPTMHMATPRTSTPTMGQYNAPPAYQVTSGPPEQPPSKKPRHAPADERAQPRGLPETMLNYASVAERDAKSPCIGNLVTTEPLANTMRATALTAGGSAPSDEGQKASYNTSGRF